MVERPIGAAQAQSNPEKGPLADLVTDQLKHNAFTARGDFNGQLLGGPTGAHVGPSRSNAIDQAALNYIFFDQGDPRRSSAYMALAETYLRSRSFKTPGEALSFFNERSSYYTGLSDTLGLDQALQGALKSGLSLSTGVLGALGGGGPGAVFGLGSSLIDLGGSYNQVDRALRAMDLPKTRSALRERFAELKLALSLYPEGTRPLLKQIILGDSKASDQAFSAAVMNLPATKQDLADAASAQGGAVPRLFAGLMERMNTLHGTIGRQGADIDQIKKSVGVINEHLLELSKKTEALQKSVTALAEDARKGREKTAIQQRAMELQTDIRNFNTTVQNIGLLLKWSPDDVNKVTGVLEGVAAIAAGYMTSNPLLFVAGLSTVAATLFGKGSSRPTPTEVMLQVLQKLAEHIDKRFDRLEQMLGKLDDRLLLFREETRTQFTQLQAQIEQVASEERVTRAFVIRGVADIKELINTQTLREMKTSWESLVSAVTYYEDSYYKRATAPENQLQLMQGRLIQAEQALREKAASFMTNLRLDTLGFGNAAFVGQESDHEKWLDDLDARFASSADAEAMAERVFICLRRGNYTLNGRPMGHSVHRILTLIMSSVPDIEVSDEHRGFFQQGPGSLNETAFVPLRNVPLFDPSDVLSAYRNVTLLLSAIPDIALRKEIGTAMEARLRPAAQMVGLWSTTPGSAVLVAAYPALVASLFAEIGAIFGSSYGKVAWAFGDFLGDIVNVGVRALPYSFGWDPYRKTLHLGGRHVAASLALRTEVSKYVDLDALEYDGLGIFFKEIAEFQRLSAAGLTGSPVETRTLYRAIFSRLVERLNRVPKLLDAGLEQFLRAGQADGKTTSLRERLRQIADLFVAVRVVERLLNERSSLAQSMIDVKFTDSNGPAPTVISTPIRKSESVESLVPYMDFVLRSAVGRDEQVAPPLFHIAFGERRLTSTGNLIKIETAYLRTGEILDRKALPTPLPGDTITENGYKYFIPKSANSDTDVNIDKTQKRAVKDRELYGIEVEVEDLHIEEVTPQPSFWNRRIEVVLSHLNGVDIAKSAHVGAQPALSRVVQWREDIQEAVARGTLYRRMENGFYPNFRDDRKFHVFRLTDPFTVQLRFRNGNEPREKPIERINSSFAWWVLGATQPEVLRNTISDTCFELMRAAENLRSDIQLMTLRDDVIAAMRLPKDEKSFHSFIETQINEWYR
ncbi:MAG: hypothetical protein K2Y40_08100 [Reyranella sp.]|jgi:archaellum component FlaC|nr:hypothetical protein [Reyranella sp.]